jgi:tetratricopeptide (TPR) repeat protein
MADKASILRDAQKFLSKGQIDKAIVEGEKLVKSFPDSNSFNFLGDLYLKKGNKPKASESYHKTAKVFRDEGFSLKALASYKKILNINPSDSDALLALGELNEEKNITTDAIKFYLAAADSFYKANQKEDTLKVYTKILHLAPQNIPLRAKIAEMFAKQGFTSQAAGEYRGIGEGFEEKDELEKAKDYFIKSMDVQPGSRRTMLALSRIAEKSGDLEQALNYVKIAVERTGEHNDLLLRKVELFAAKGSFDDAHVLLNTLLEGGEADTKTKKVQAYLFTKAGDKEKAWEIYNPLLDDMIADEQYDEAKEILKTFRKAEPVEVSKKFTTIFRNVGDNESAIKEIMALAGFYERKGMMHDALNTYNGALIIEPDNAMLAEKIEAIRKQLVPEDSEQPETPEVPPVSEAPEMPPVSEISEMPPISEIPEMPPISEIPEMPPISEIPEMPPISEASEMPEAPAVAQDKTQDEAMTEVDVFLRYGLYNEAKTRLEALKINEPENIDVHLKLKSLYKETHNNELAVTECIVLAELYGRAGDQENRKLHITEAYEMNPADPRLADKLQEIGITPEDAEAQAGLQDMVGESLDAYQNDLTEAEFYTKQGFFKEAADIYERLSGKFPDNDELKGKLNEALQELGVGPIAEGADGMETLSFDDLLSDAAPAGGVTEPTLENDVLEVFEEFKKGIEDSVESEDTETHYNLGIAYKEMGLLDDAISTFQTTKNNPKFFVQASTMLSNCYMEKGLYSLAIDTLQDILVKIDAKHETAWSIKYDIAEAYEKDGKPDDALKYYTEVYGWDSTFREVADKINALKESAPPKKAAEPKAAEPKKPTKQKKPTDIATKRKSRVSYI